MLNKKVMKIILVIMGALIGAGFASGKEIYIFFARFGLNGIIGIFISAIFTGFVIYCCLNIIGNNKICNGIEFANEIKENKLLYQILNAFLLILFYIMIAGFSSYFKQEFNINVYITSAILCIILYFILINKIVGIITVSTIILPVLIIIILYIAIKYNIVNENEKIMSNNLIICVINAILYSSYNSILLIPILITLEKYVESKKEKIMVSSITSILIIILTMGLYGILVKSNSEISNIEIPVISILDNKIEKYLYSISIEIAIITSAIVAGYGVLDNLNENIKSNSIKYKKVIAVMCLAGIPISGIGFGNLINTMYPLFGGLGLIQIMLIFQNKLEKKRKN